MPSVQFCLLNSEIDSNLLIRPPAGVNVKRRGREIFKTKTKDEWTELFKKEGSPRTGLFTGRDRSLRKNRPVQLTPVITLSESVDMYAYFSIIREEQRKL